MADLLERGPLVRIAEAAFAAARAAARGVPGELLQALEAVAIQAGELPRDVPIDPQMRARMISTARILRGRIAEVATQYRATHPD